jgi:hypothetical protein
VAGAAGESLRRKDSLFFLPGASYSTLAQLPLSTHSWYNFRRGEVTEKLEAPTSPTIFAPKLVMPPRGEERRGEVSLAGRDRKGGRWRRHFLSLPTLTAN